MGFASSKLDKTWINQKGEILILEWNKVKNVTTYSVVVWRNNGEAGRPTGVRSNNFKHTLLPGSTYHFIISVVDGERNLHIESETIHTCPSEVTGINVSKYNGLEISWRELCDEEVKYCVEFYHTGKKIDGVMRTTETTFRIGYEKLRPGSSYVAKIWAVGLNGKIGPTCCTDIQYDSHPSLDIACHVLCKDAKVVLFFMVNKHQDPTVLHRLGKFIDMEEGEGFVCLKTLQFFITLKSKAEFRAQISCHELPTIARPLCHSMHCHDLVNRGFIECDFILVPKITDSYTLELNVKCGDRDTKTPFTVKLEKNTAIQATAGSRIKPGANRATRHKSGCGKPHYEHVSDDYTTSDSGFSSYSPPTQGHPSYAQRLRQTRENHQPCSAGLQDELQIYIQLFQRPGYICVAYCTDGGVELQEAFQDCRKVHSNPLQHRLLREKPFQTALHCGPGVTAQPYLHKVQPKNLIGGRVITQQFTYSATADGQVNIQYRLLQVGQEEIVHPFVIDCYGIKNQDKTGVEQKSETPRNEQGKSESQTASVLTVIGNITGGVKLKRSPVDIEAGGTHRPSSRTHERVKEEVDEDLSHRDAYGGSTVQTSNEILPRHRPITLDQQTKKLMKKAAQSNGDAEETETQTLQPAVSTCTQTKDE